MDCKIWEPKEFLCGYSPRTGSLIIGSIGIGISILNVAHLLLYATMPYADFFDYCTEQHAVNTDACATGLISAIIIFGSVSLITIIGCVLLLFGVKKEEPNFIVVYLAIKVFSLVLYGTFTVCLMMYLFFTIYAYWNCLIVIIGVLGIYLEVYLFLCVRVYYKQLKYTASYQRTEDSRAYPFKVTVLNPVRKIQKEEW